jgi:hypothetical protein
MPEHRIPRAHLHEDLLRLYREDHERVTFIDPNPDENDRVYVTTESMSAVIVTRPLSDEEKTFLKERFRAYGGRAALEIKP